MNVFSARLFRRVLISSLVLCFAAGCDDRGSENNVSADASTVSDVFIGNSDTEKDPQIRDTSTNQADVTSSDTKDETNDKSLCERIALGHNADLRGERLFPADPTGISP